MNLMGIILLIANILLSYLPKTTYSEGVADQPMSFLPSKVRSHHEKTVSSLIYRGLFKYDIYGTLIPDLVETWSISDDGLVYTIKIKENVKWSDGRTIKSDDIIYTSFKLSSMEGVATDKVDDYTVRFILPNRYAPFLSLLTVGIMPQNVEEKNHPLRPVSSGEFTVARVDKNGNIVKKVVLLSNNPEHKIKRIVFKYYSNEKELSTAYKLGEIDAFVSEDSFELESTENHKFPIQSIYYSLYFNLRNEQVNDLEFRKKLEKTLPIESIIADRGISVQGPISRSIYTDREIKFVRYDPEFKEDMEDKKILLTIPNTEDHYELAERIREYWKISLDLDTEIIKIDKSRIYSDVIAPRKFEVLLYGQEVGRDPDRYVNWYSTQSDDPGLNISGLDQVRIDRALEEGRNETEYEKRLVHYNEVQKTVAENVPCIFLYHPYVNYYVTKYVRGIGEKYTHNYQDRFLDFYNWEKVKTN